MTSVSNKSISNQIDI